MLRRGLLSDVHAPAKWRVIGPLANIPDFYDAFGVTQGQSRCGARRPIACVSGDLMADSQDQTGGAVKERSEVKKQDPTLYKVVLLNDDYSTMQFVIEVLETVFTKSPAEAYRVMMHVHVNGKGLAGVYPWDIAETKVDTVTTMARTQGYPLKAVIEEE